MRPTRRELGLATAASLLLGPSPVRARVSDAPVKLTPTAQREDLAVLKRALAESHVGLHWRVTPAEFATRLKRLDELAARPAAARAVHLRLARFVASLGHGHTTLDAPATGTGFRLRRLAIGSGVFPLGVRVVGGRLYVAHDLSETVEVGAGVELLAVNGTPAPQLVADLAALLSADGDAIGFKHYQLGPGWRLHDLLTLVQGARDRHRVRFRRADGRAAETTLRAATPEELAARHLERRGRSIDAFRPAVAYERRDRVGVLTVGSLYEGLLPPGSAGFAAEFERAFAEIASDRVERLVLDLRENEGGGSDYVPLLYGYLADRPFRLADPTVVASAFQSTLRWAEAPSDVLQAFAADPSRFVASDPAYGFVLRPEFDQIRYRHHAPAAGAYTGPLTVLVDGGSFSATGILLDVIHRHHRHAGRPVEFVGEAPGVDTRLGWSSGGQSLRLVLPNSGLRVAIPLLGTRDHFGSWPARLPDRVLEPSLSDLRDQIDGVLAGAARA